MVLVTVAFFAFPLFLALALSPLSSDSVPRMAQIAATGDPPMLFPPDVFAVAGVPLQVDVPVYDPNDDNVNVTWDFGDGSPTAVTMSAPAGIFDPMVVVSQNHTWNPVVTPGTGDYDVYYTLTLTCDDGNGNILVQTAPAHVLVPDNEPPSIQIQVPFLSVGPADDVLIIASATDAEGDALTWTFVFNNTDLNQDFLTLVNFTPVSAPGELIWRNVSHVFGAEGDYTVKLFVSDALPGNQVFPNNKSATSTVISVAYNRIPTVLAVVNVDPQSPIINNTLGYVRVNYFISAFDLDGDILNATWDFGDGSPSITNTSAGGKAQYTFEQVWICNHTGTFNVSVVVTDGRPGHAVLVYALVNVTSLNMPPSLVNYFFIYPHNLTFALVNETQYFVWVFSDPENDPIEVMVDFGDNSTLAFFNLTAFVDNNVTLNLTHSYSKTGSYTVTVWYSDNKVGGGLNHNKSIESTVIVRVVESPKHDYWDWWDYTGIGIFMMIPVLIVARVVFVSRRRKQLEDQGMTLEEWELIKSVSEANGQGDKD